MSIASLVIRGKLPPSTQPEEQNQRLKALKEELSHAEYIPIYPWIAPPTPLPGPYDAPYYPLPSIRKYSHDSSTTESPPPEELQSHIRHSSARAGSTRHNYRVESWLASNAVDNFQRVIQARHVQKYQRTHSQPHFHRAFGVSSRYAVSYDAAGISRFPPPLI
ncbi:hypothetical protein SNOG_10341 [Parastagonospora nodorum SN15]|uniref:Uncharacterized protein n=1 Tax=Phaeosphaeria nodorum (strain SN15 / ATCC MYA-4574 / FGSC 10173) TaxID=321614 RepID=Q0UD23_PHANO|nr:hypothetical protein SNOG_10341 [Parastagonospora nodorum SN15]EAT82676.1 hypothetical protein SNOG_10341 [Parastagonospora nodorum SN15]